MQQNADMATNAIIWHYMVPCVIGLIVLGILAIALEIIKNLIRREFRKHSSKRPGRRT